MILFRALGWLFVALALWILGRDVWLALTGGAFRFSVIGEIWNMVHSNSLQLLQPAVERHVHPDLFLTVILPILEIPASLLLIVPGLILVVLARPKKRKRVHF